ncbi:Serine/threonine phosphatase stp [Rubripirellula lacrimiformis]|uniref:Serine/threonine phosphatase stp n=1 Tax=Rubripirellula lacrimiformis TaxID=1930273 RepID=A0A517NHV8_9BACT|nr:protein phosphatase 2C domain-containing protein [Rubripirellula lacrimiformis]QDT06643.1 Serine/threonine phosphatase stp [Rubripirellula lacrimiformis]
MRITASGDSHVGRVRTGNEDSFLIDESIGLYMVCDGMGGHASGEVASERAIAFASQYIQERKSILATAGKSPGGYFQVVEMLEQAIQFANDQLYRLGMVLAGHQGMGTTLTLVLVLDAKAIMGHVGDSRLYVIRDDRVHQLSTDHTLANEMISQGQLSPDAPELDRYSHVLTRAIGTRGTVEVETLLFDLFPDDVCVLCSDGLSNYLPAAARLGELVDRQWLQSAPSALIEYAMNAGGSDNITAITLLARPGDDPTGGPEDLRRRLKLLKDSFLCKGLSESRAMRLLNHSDLVCASAGQRLAVKNGPDAGVYFIHKGRIALETPDGREVELVSPSYFGETMLLRGGNPLSSAIISEDAELQFISRRRFDALSRRFPKLGRQLYKNLATEICRRYCDQLSLSSTALEDTLLEDEHDLSASVMMFDEEE